MNESVTKSLFHHLTKLITLVGSRICKRIYDLDVSNFTKGVRDFMIANIKTAIVIFVAVIFLVVVFKIPAYIIFVIFGLIIFFIFKLRNE